MQRALWALLGLLLMACGEDLSIEEACADYCRCSQTLPSQQRACQASCEEQLVELQPDQTCLQCVATYACDGQDDRYCSLVCSDDQE